MIKKLHATMLTNYDESRKRLDLHNQGIEDKDLPEILKFVNEHEISNLVIFKNYISDEGIKLIVANENIDTLNLALNRVTDVGAEYLAKSNKLKKLDLCGNRLTAKGIEAFKKNKVLIEIDLDNNVNDDEIQNFTDPIDDKIKTNSDSVFSGTSFTIFNANSKEKTENFHKKSEEINSCILQ